MRIIGVDIGEKRIGISLSDPTELIASPLTTILRTECMSDIHEISRLIIQNDVSKIIVGLPLELSGRIGFQANEVIRFVEILSKNIKIPVELEDERLSSVMAEKLLRETGAKPSRNKGRIDAAAATVILQRYLDSN